MSEEKETASFTELKVNKELQEIVPPLPEDKYQLLKTDIAENGVQVEILTMPDKTIIDGYHRYKAVGELITEKKMSIIYPIPIIKVPITHVQEALEFSIRINLKRRHLSEYQEIVWALKVYGKTHTQEEIARIIGRTKTQVATVAGLESNIVSLLNKDEKAKEIFQSLQIGEIGVSKASKTLRDVLDINGTISEIEDDAFREEMEIKYEIAKYKPNAMKHVMEDIDQHDNPEDYKSNLDSYGKLLGEACRTTGKAYASFPSRVKIIHVEGTDFTELDEYIKKLKEEAKDPMLGKDFYNIFVFSFAVPKELQGYFK